MPNYCYYIMKARGTDENLNTLTRYLQNGYTYVSDDDNWCKDRNLESEYKLRYDSSDGKHHLYTNAEKHLYRVFEAYVENIDDEDDDKKSYIISGDCAWSVYSCMFEDKVGTYYSSNPTDEFAELRKIHATTIPKLSKELDLDIEIYSSESGCCFAEHYIVKRGAIITDEEFNYNEFYLGDYETKKEAEDDLGIEITDQEWNDEDYIVRCDINPNDPEWTI